MSELGGTASVGIDNVEWIEGGGRNLTLRVTGRWRRRRPSSGGAPVLVVESEGRRHRFPALPEPPSLESAAQGMWRLSFSVPGDLAPALGAHAWLAFGSVIVPLPVPESAASPPPRSDAPAQEQSAAPRDEEETAAPPTAPAASGPLEIERAWRRADDAEQASGRLAEQNAMLKQALEDERRQVEAAASSLADGDRRRREAEQRAHAERAMRRDLTRRLEEDERRSARSREALGELATAEQRVRELETELREARRTGDEAGRAAAAARAAQRRAESAMAQMARRRDPDRRREAQEGAERDRVRLEQTVRAGRPGAPRIPEVPPASSMPVSAFASATPPRPVPAPLDPSVPESAVVAALRRELHARVAAEAGLRARTVQAETRLATRVLLEQRTSAALHDLRGELGTLRGELERERERRRRAEATAARLTEELGGQRERSRDAYEAIGELRGALDHLRPPASESEPAPGAVTPERLSDALARLREASDPRDPAADPDPGLDPGPDAPAPPAAVPAPAGRPAVGLPALRAPAAAPSALLGRPTVDVAFRRLVAADAGLAGRLLLDLLGAQHAAWPYPVAYDLVLGPARGCVQVTVTDAGTALEVCPASRAREQVDFQLTGDPARIARLLVAGGWRRLLRIGLARVRGRRDRVQALRSLLALPLDLVALRAAGMRDEPETLLALVAAMIDPAWTRGERFTVAHRDAQGRVVHLEIRDGRPPAVTRDAPEGRVSVTLHGSAEELARALGAGPGAAPATAGGDAAALALVREWINRARSG